MVLSDLSAIVDAFEAELVEELRNRGYDVRKPHPATLIRRRQRDNQVREVPVIARSTRFSLESSGGPKHYWQLDEEEQAKIDHGPWRIGASVRRDLAPMTFGVGSEVLHVREVLAYHQADGGKWRPVFGRKLTSEELEEEWPWYPFLPGKKYPGTKVGGAYYPVRISV